MDCMTDYNWADPSNLLQLSMPALQPLLAILSKIKAKSVVPVVRIPLTASYWLGVKTKNAGPNMAKYPNLDKQYQRFIGDLVGNYTTSGIVAILDLHWTDDDVEQQPMAGKGATDSVVFWDSIAGTFGANDMVFYELYNEPHTSDTKTYINGDANTAGMLEMLAAVRKHSLAPAIIAGATQYAYDSASLLELEKALLAQQEGNVLFNYHPYMGPAQAGASDKCAPGFEQLVRQVVNGTERPVIVTEFGQACQPTDGPAEKCAPTGATGYDEAIIQIAGRYSASWLPWAWRAGATGPNNSSCMDVNGGTDPPGLSLAHPTDGRGADFQSLWQKYAGVGPVPGPPSPPPPTPPSPPSPSPPSPPPGPCPGGTMEGCMAACPSSPASAFKACVDACAAQCDGQLPDLGARIAA